VEYTEINEFCAWFRVNREKISDHDTLSIMIEKGPTDEHYFDQIVSKWY